jgi:carbamoyl-phosphate synthase small subunit
MEVKLVLEDGSCFKGTSIFGVGEKIGEIILNTAVVGYQELLTDPSNAGKILVLTYPLIGNYGTSSKFNESKKSYVEALVVKELSRIYSNWQAEDSLANFLKKQKTFAVEGIDTRTLAVKIREKGEMFGIVSTKEKNENKLLKRLKKAVKNKKKNFIKDISAKKTTKVRDNASGKKIAVLDLGMTSGFLKQLKTLGCSVTFLPFDTSAEKILKANYKGLIISNGPEDDKAIPKVVKTVKKLLGKIPVLGISTGHEVIALALGGKLKKMKLGHHGVNYPVLPAPMSHRDKQAGKPPNSFKGEITVQNHSFVVDEDSIKDRKDIEITLKNVNDNSIEEMESKKLKFISTQYYPASPGFDEVNPVFKRFMKLTNKK